MSLPWRPIRCFQRTLHLWLFGYLVSAAGAAEWLWLQPMAPALPAPSLYTAPLTHAFGSWVPVRAVPYALLLLGLLAARGVFLPQPRWVVLLEWVLFTSATNAAWLASSGGHQLIGNVLFWSVLLPVREPVPWTGERVPWGTVVDLVGFWVIRLQLLLAYAVTGVQKLTGDHWPTGHAVGIVATDPDFGPAWLGAVPALAVCINYAVLAFQLTFPLAVWWEPTRRWWMWMGLLFHLSTGLTFGILDMGLAFVCVYPIWMEPSSLQRVLHWRPLSTARAA